MVWFGDIDIPIVSNKDTGITVETIDTNFVDNPARSYKLYSTLESGTYEFFLNSHIHNRSETLSEQKDAILSMVDRHGTEFPVEDGFVSLNTVNHSTTPSEMVDNASASLHYLEYPEYSLGYKVNSYNKSDTLSLSDYSYLGVSSELDVVSKTSDFSISVEGGQLDYYQYAKKDLLEISYPNFVSSVERVGPCRFYNNSERVYSKNKYISNFRMDNGLIRVDESASALDLYFYDNQWNNIGSIPFNYTSGYVARNENKSIELEFIDSNNLAIHRSLPIIEQKNVTDEINVNVDVDSVIEKTDSYISVLTANGYEFILSRSENDGNFSNTSTTISIKNITSEVDVSYGVVPGSVTREQVRQMALSRGRVKRTFV